MNSTQKQKNARLNYKTKSKSGPAIAWPDLDELYNHL